MIRFESVSKLYPGGTTAVEDLSLTAESGQITVLVGPSGCGKTTSLRMINRMIEPTSGRIWLDGRDTALGSAAELRRGIGYVIQHAGLFPHRTIVDNVATVPFLLRRNRATARQEAMELLERVGLPPAQFAKRYPAQLSGGQQQRVGVARALAADPPVMLMDEPFSAVDPVVRSQLQDEFLRLQFELGKTIVFVTHDIDEAIKLGDQVAVLRVGGKLAQLAPPADLLSRPADAFVAGFVGRDRGYRALGFTSAGNLPLSQEPHLRFGESLSGAVGLTEDGWVLVVDDERRPQGWLSVRGVADTSGEVTPELLNLGGTLAEDGGSLRSLLDAALSSPSGRGVVVDADGRLQGTLTAAAVLRQIEERQQPVATQAPVLISYYNAHSSEINSWLGWHARLAGIPLLLGLLIALPLGWMARQYRWLYPPLISVSGAALHDPSLALFIILPGIIKTKILDPNNVIVALTIYTVALLVRVVADGLAAVPPEVTQAATAMGYRRLGRFLRVELPIAVPVIAAGLRVAAVSNVSLVSVASLIGVPELGQLFTRGFQLYYQAPVQLGIVLSLALALAFDVVIQVLTRVLTPWRRAVATR